jgi:hypothetical protein
VSEYPNLWKCGLIQPRVKARAGHCCEECGMAFHPDSNLSVSAVNRLGKPIIGTVHHIDERKDNCAMSNLVFLCQRCHFRIHVLHWYPGKPLPRCWQPNPPLWLVIRGLAPAVFQLSLFEVMT